MGRPNHDRPAGQVRKLQSPPMKPAWQLHRYAGGPLHKPLPPHSTPLTIGQVAMGSSAKPQSPRVPPLALPLPETYPVKQPHTPVLLSQVPRPEQAVYSVVPRCKRMVRGVGRG